MKKTDLEKITTKLYSVYYNGEYVVLPSTKLYILKTDGSLVACRDDLRAAYRITFLSGNRMLLCNKTVFHMINLCDGSDIWTAPYTKHEMDPVSFAVSQDEAFAYTYDRWRGTSFISRLNLQTQEVDAHVFRFDIGATLDILCNKEDVPCLLKSLSEKIGGKIYAQIGVRLHDFFYDVSPGNTTSWETKWSFEGTRGVRCFLDSTDAIVTSDLHIYKPSTGTSYGLLANETSWQQPGHSPIKCWLDISKRYLCLLYSTVNVIIDIQARKVAAQYASDFTQGCLIGDEYWVCVDHKLLRKPFPAFEDASPVKVVGGSDHFYAKHPELW